MEEVDNSTFSPANSSWMQQELHEIISAEEESCFEQYSNRTSIFQEYDTFCNTTWDGLSCWPAANADSIVYVPCFSEFNGVQYNTLRKSWCDAKTTGTSSQENASRACNENGSWAEKSDYTSCKPLVQEELAVQPFWDLHEAATIYYVGYGISLVALIAALSIFLYFKNLRCLRNNIHTNLLVTYLLLDLTWIITATLQSVPSATGYRATCILFVMLMYLMGTNFFWMFVEGMYLYILAVKTFSIEVVRMPVYSFIGWVLPAPIVITWAVIKIHMVPHSGDPLGHGCVFPVKDNFDYIFIIPVFIVLLVNVFFLCEIMWVLITKLRVSASAESKQYRKAAKALLVLIPLLGMTYILVIVTPSHKTWRVVFTYLQAVLLSTQGFTVAILYCFLNGEVQKSLMHLWKRWTTRRTIHGSMVYSFSYRSSHNSDNNLKLYRSRGAHTRGSCASFTTTTTSVCNNWQSSCNRLGCD